MNDDRIDDYLRSLDDTPQQCPDCLQTLADIAEAGNLCPMCFFAFEPSRLSAAMDQFHSRQSTETGDHDVQQGS
jgi:hypothetical protein